MAILFWRVSDTYGAFSNFYVRPIQIDGVTWKTVEHYYQAQKFDPRTLVDGYSYQDMIRFAYTPMEAATLGRSKEVPIRPNWDQIKDSVMFNAVLVKFASNTDLRKLLISTGEEEIIEASPTDSYWGWGPDQKGLNQLGQVLMHVRSILAQAS